MPSGQTGAKGKDQKTNIQRTLNREYNRSQRRETTKRKSQKQITMRGSEKSKGSSEKAVKQTKENKKNEIVGNKEENDKGRIKTKQQKITKAK
jgi:hypothetical protein